jgi:hypothetical protein
MHRGVTRHRRCWVPISAIASLTLLVPVVHAQGINWFPQTYPQGGATWNYPQAAVPYYGYPQGYAANPYYRMPYYPGQVYYQTAYRPGTQYAPNCPNCQPCYPQTLPVPAMQPAPAEQPAPAVQPAPKEAPPAAAPTQPTTTPTPPSDELAQAPETGPELGGAGAAIGSSNVGYIDSAIPRTQVRVRFDAAYDDNRPDRAEFIYPKCGCFATLPPGNPLRDPKAPGPPLPETRIDWQQIRSYIEYAPTKCFSAFVEVPVTFLHPHINVDSRGIGDVEAGVKYAVIAKCDRYLTLQTKIYVPSGQAGEGLGTGHPSVEPGILWYWGLGNRARFEGEVRDWIPFNGTDFEGNVLRVGIGASYDVWKNCTWRLAPVAEFVGWEVLGGQELDALTGAVLPASGNTIVNAKGGLRLSSDHFSIYAGYGRALTGAVWYKDIARVEMKLMY